MPEEKTENLAYTTIRGTTWVYIAFFSSKLVVFITTIILARYLSKSDFGVVAYAITIIGFLDVVKDLGVSLSLIYYRDESFVPTGFWLSLLTNVSFFLLTWFGAPFVGAFFNDDRAIWVTRILAINFPLNALGAIHETYLIKDLAFNRKFIPDIARAFSKGILSIGLAIAGFGPWSLIVGQLGGTLISVIVLWRIVPWRPAFEFASSTAGSLLRYGIPLVSMNIISGFVLNMDYLFVGRYLGAEALGVYTLAFRIPELTILQLCNIVAQVIFPVFAKIKDDLDALSAGFLKTAQYVALITVPVSFGLVVLAEPFVLALFGEKWISVVPVMRAIAIYTMLISLGFNAGDVYKAQGRPGILTKMELFHAALLFPILLWVITTYNNIVYVGWAQVFVAFVVNSVYLIVALRILNLHPMRLIDALKAPFIPAVVMALILVVMMNTVHNIVPWLKLMIGVPVGALVYIGVLWMIDKSTIVDSIYLARTMITNRFSNT